MPRLTEGVLSRKTHLGPRESKLLRTSLKGRVKGFTKNVLLAPDPILAPVLREIALADPHVVLNLLWFWKRLYPEVLERVRSGAAQDEPRVDPQDLQLARVALDAFGERAQLPEAVLPARFTAFLAQLEGLPADAPEWEAETVEAFKSQLDELVRNKRTQRDLDRRRTLAERLESLRSEWGSIPDLAWESWSPDLCPPDTLDDVSLLLERLAELLEQRRSLQQQLSSASLREQLDLLARLRELTGQILSVGKQVSSHLASKPSGTSDASPAPSPAAGSGAAERAAAPVTASPPPQRLEPSTVQGAREEEDGEEEERAAGRPESVTDASRAGPERVVEEDEGAAVPLDAGVAVVEEDRSSAVWSLLLQKDLEGAFWFARALEETGVPSPVPSDLLRTLVGSRWLASGKLAPGEVQEAINRAMERLGGGGGLSAPVKPLLAAACLLPALTHPETGAASFLEPLPPPFDPLNPLIDAIRSFAVRFQDSLRPRDLTATLQDQEVERGIQRRCREAAERLEKARARRVSGSYLPATLIFWYLTREDSSATDNLLFQVLSPVSTDRREAVEAVRDLVRKNLNRSHLDRLLQRLQEKVVAGGHTVGRLEGWARGRLIKEVEDALRLAEDWADLVLRKGTQRVRDERRQQVERLVREVSAVIPDTLRGLQELESHGDPHVRALAGLLEESVQTLQRVLVARGVADTKVPPWACEGLDAGLAFRLLGFPDLEPEEGPAGEPCVPPAQWKELARRLVDGAGMGDPACLAASWLRHQDLRWVGELLKQVPEGPQRDALEAEVAAIRDRLRAVEKRLPDLTSQVEQGMLEGSLGPTERAELQSELQEVEAVVQKGRVRVPALVKRLAAIEEKLLAYQQRALEERRRDWETLRPRLAPLLSEDEWQRVDDLVSSGSEGRNLAVVDELLAQVRRAVERDDPTPVRELLLNPADKKRDILKEFLEEREPLQKLLEQVPIDRLERDVRAQGHLRLRLGMTRLPKERHAEVAEALRAWSSLKYGQPGPQNQMGLFALLRYLGLLIEGPRDIHQRGGERDWSLWEAKVTGYSPVPEYGSEGGGRLKILVVWARPGTSHLENILQASHLRTADPVLVVYLARLLPKQWDDLVRWAHKRDFKGIVLDETLLVFLAREYQVRLDAFFRCSLPASAVNPYRPDGRANLPPEMFFGRSHLVSALMDPEGPIYVYGGRQLGKSSLLARVRHDFHDPCGNRYAFLLDIKVVGDPNGVYPDPGQVWIRLAQEVLPGLSGSTSVRKPPKVYEELAKFLRSNPDARVLVLLDEADHFLLSDAEKSFANVNLMNQLVIDTHRRFRVVFAGLKNVRRFRHIPNQPMVGRAVVIGPLEPRDAMALVKEPLDVLGYRMEDQALLRILTVTNYHPGLIQALCYRMLDWLRRQHLIPPYAVTLQDVEAVVRDPDLQKAIQDRFLWTLALDPHYGVIVRAMAYDQMERPDGFARVYSLGELRDLAADWWPNEFLSLSPERVRGYAEELKDIGILVESEPDHFRLHSPNLVRLLGAKGELEEWLLRAGEQDMDPYGRRWQTADDLHPQVGTQPDVVYSPLTAGQLRLLGIGESGLTLLAGSAATGIDRVSRLIEAFAATRGGFGVNKLSGKAADELTRVVREKIRRRTGSGGLLLLVGDIEAGDGGEMAQAVQAMLKEFRRASEAPLAEGWVRVLLFLEPGDIDRLVGVPSWALRSLEVATGMTVLEPWSRNALGRALDEQEIPGQEDRGLYPVTSGYHLLVEEALTRLRQRREPARVATELVEGLFKGERPLGKRFLEAAGVRPGTPLGRLARSIAEVVQPERAEDTSTLIELMAEELHEQAETVVRGILALTYRGLLIRDQSTVRMPAVPHRLLREIS